MNVLAEFFAFIVRNSWQGSLVILLVFAVRPFLGTSLSACWRHLLWTLVLIRLLIPLVWLPASSLSLQNVHALDQPLQQVETAVETSSEQPVFTDTITAPPEEAIPLASGRPAVPTSSSTTLPWRFLTAAIWAAGVLLGLGYVAVLERAFFRRIVSAVLPVPDRIDRLWRDCCLRLNARRRPDLLVSSALDSPLLMGVFRARLVLPQQTLESYTDEEFEHIFAHELAHFKRADHWVQALQLLILCLHWFNPLVWLAYRAARIDCEMAADEWALNRLRLISPNGYGHTLLKMVAERSGRPLTPAALGIMESHQQLKIRLRRIVQSGSRTWFGPLPGAATALVLAMGVLSSGALAASLLSPHGTVYDRNGVALVEDSPQGRHYVYGALAAQVLGFASEPKSSASKAVANESHGVEGMLASPPQGSSKPVRGNVHLTLDACLQYIAETALREARVTRGAVVIMNPKNGDVLAMVSLPSYDPNTIAKGLSVQEWDAVHADPAQPLVNRALRATTPGATFKTVVALAGLKSGKVTTDTRFDCPAQIDIGDHHFIDAGHAETGPMKLAHAIQVSSNVFFYQYGMRTGIHAIDAMATCAGFGQKWGILGAADEDVGIVPGPEWMKQNEIWLTNNHHLDHWSDAHTANTSIGQGYVQTTPLQMTAFTCALANGGTVYRPRLYTRIEDDRGNLQTRFPESQLFGTLGVKASDLAVVQQSLLEVVQSGTGRLAQVSGIDVAGKTGTAQTLIQVDGVARRDFKSWFSGYAPFENPRYVVTVLVEGSKPSEMESAPVAGQILTRIFTLEKSGDGTVKSVPPVKGDFSGAQAFDTSGK